MKFITQFSRFFVGILFIFSGLIKLNDPMGFSFKLGDYFAADVLNLPFLMDYTLPLALFIVILEVILGEHVGDKTAWQTMLKGDGDALDLKAKQRELYDLCQPAIEALQATHGVNSIQWLTEADADAAEVTIAYPVLEWPTKVKAHNLDKTPVVEGTLMGIKGQYLMLDTGVINIRKYGGYRLQFKVD